MSQTTQLLPPYPGHLPPTWDGSTPWLVTRHAEVDDLPFRHDMSTYGLHALSVTWDAADVSGAVA